MKIIISYDSSWQTSFLGDNKKKPNKKNTVTNIPGDTRFMQKFVATSQTKGEKNSPITKNTVLGLLCRLIGDQRKLYQSRKSDHYHFRDLEEKISFKPLDIEQTTELTYLTNKSDDRCAKSLFLGVIQDDNPWFFSQESSRFWSVLFLDKHSLLKFILSDKPLLAEVNCEPKKLFSRLEDLSNKNFCYGSVLQTKEVILEDISKQIEKNTLDFNKKIESAKRKPIKKGVSQKKYDEAISRISKTIKTLEERYEDYYSDPVVNEWDNSIQKIAGKLENKFPDQEYITNGTILPMRLYAASLYLQAERLIECGYSLDYMKNNKGDIQIQGFSKRGFNGRRDWINPMTGKRKKQVGTPCNIQKQSGSLEIILDISKDKAKKLRTRINNAGVSSFYLGKKGLAYIEDIKVAEVRK